MKKLKLKPLTFILILLAIVAIVLTLIRIEPKNISVVSTYPQNNAADLTLVTPIQINFSSPIPQKEPLNLTINPSINGTITYSQDGKQIIFTPNNLYQSRTTYNITISSRSIKDYSFQFTTLTPRTFGDLISPTTTATPPISNPSTTPGTINLPKSFNNLISSMPHTTATFTIKYVMATDRFLIYPETADEAKAEQDALTYIKSFGFTDPYKQLRVSFVNRITPLNQTNE